jgi:hypothetical protein
MRIMDAFPGPDFASIIKYMPKQDMFAMEAVLEGLQSWRYDPSKIAEFGLHAQTLLLEFVLNSERPEALLQSELPIRIYLCDLMAHCLDHLVFLAEPKVSGFSDGDAALLLDSIVLGGLFKGLAARKMKLCDPVPQSICPGAGGGVFSRVAAASKGVGRGPQGAPSAGPSRSAPPRHPVSGPSVGGVVERSGAPLGRFQAALAAPVVSGAAVQEKSWAARVARGGPAPGGAPAGPSVGLPLPHTSAPAASRVPVAQPRAPVTSGPAAAPRPRTLRGGTSAPTLGTRSAHPSAAGPGGGAATTRVAPTSSPTWRPSLSREPSAKVEFHNMPLPPVDDLSADPAALLKFFKEFLQTAGFPAAVLVPAKSCWFPRSVSAKQRKAHVVIEFSSMPAAQAFMQHKGRVLQSLQMGVYAGFFHDQLPAATAARVAATKAFVQTHARVRPARVHRRRPSGTAAAPVDHLEGAPLPHQGALQVSAPELHPAVSATTATTAPRTTVAPSASPTPMDVVVPASTALNAGPMMDSRGAPSPTGLLQPPQARVRLLRRSPTASQPPKKVQVCQNAAGQPVPQEIQVLAARSTSVELLAPSSPSSSARSLSSPSDRSRSATPASDTTEAELLPPGSRVPRPRPRAHSHSPARRSRTRSPPAIGRLRPPVSALAVVPSPASTAGLAPLAPGSVASPIQPAPPASILTADPAAPERR